MALHDSDPNTTNRIEPLPQAPDEKPYRQADSTTSITNKQNASSGPRLTTKNATINAYDGTVSAATFGLLPDGAYGLKASDGTNDRLLVTANGIKLSQSGFDVKTATDAQLIWSSSFNSFKIVSSGTISLSGSTTASTNSQDTAVLTHGLGYTPIVLAYAVDPITGKYTPLPMSDDIRALQRNTASPNNGFTVEFMTWIYAAADTTTVTFYRFYANLNYNGAGATYSTSTMNIKYYLLRETAN